MKDINSNKNKQSDGYAKDDTNSGNKDGEVGKTENDNVRNMRKRKGTPQKITTREKRGQTDLYFA